MGPVEVDEGAENGPSEGASGGDCAPTSGSPVAPSRTCRLFPRRDSRSPHLSSVRLTSPCLSLSLSPHPRLAFDPLTTDGTRVRHGYEAGGRARLFIFRYFRSVTRERYTLRAHNSSTRLDIQERVSRRRGRLIVIDRQSFRADVGSM